MVGAPSVKLTKLLSVHLPELELRVGQLPSGGTCCHRRHEAVLKGRGPNGFRTAPAKVYPSDMCRLLALAAFDFCERHVRVGEAETRILRAS